MAPVVSALLWACLAAATAAQLCTDAVCEYTFTVQTRLSMVYNYPQGSWQTYLRVRGVVEWRAVAPAPP